MVTDMEKASSYTELLSDKDSLPRAMFFTEKNYPMNLKRIGTNQLQVLAKLLELLTGASASGTQQLIEGWILELRYQLES